MSETLPLNFYNFLCKKLGTEEVVKTRRMLYSINDKLRSERSNIFITSGSKGEGLDFQSSDLDIMQVFKTVEVYERERDIGEIDVNITYLILDMEDTNPGFTKLRVYKTNNEDILRSCVQIGNNLYLSNTKFKLISISHSIAYSDIFYEFSDISMFAIHGPCISDPDGEYDFANSFHCKDWIRPACQWIYRSRSQWPPNNTIECIVQHGVLFVPIGCKGSLYEELEWRISFSVAEKQLIYSFTHTQLFCYALLKILLSEIKRRNTVGNVLCSYYLKTIVFWVSEEIAPSFWTPLNISECYKTCVKRLLFSVEHLILPHFFIPDYNLFENRFDPCQHKELVSILIFYHNQGWSSIVQSDILKEFNTDHRSTSCTTFSRLLGVRVAYEFTHSLNRCTKYKNQDIILTSMCRSLREIESTTSINSEKRISMSHFSSCSSISAQTLQINSTGDNKSMYRRCRLCLAYLMIASYENAITGLLLTSCFFYQRKEYKISVRIINYVLSKPLLDMEKSDEHMKKPNDTCSQSPREPLIHMIQNYLLPKDLCFIEFSCLYPSEAPQSANNGFNVTSPLTLAFFLRFLCYFHLGHHRRYMEALDDMKTLQRRRRFTSLEAETLSCYWLKALQMTGKALQPLVWYP